MPKLSPNQVPSYRRHKQSGQSIVTLSGRDMLLGAYGSAASKAEYQRVTAEWLASGRRLPSPGGELTLSTLILRFWEHAKTYYRDPDGTPSKEVENFKYALVPLRRLYGATRAADFGPLALKAVRQVMIGDLHWCRNVANRQTNRIRQVFKWAAENELVPAGVYHGLLAVAGLRRGRSDARESAPVKPVPEPHVYSIKDHVSRQIWAMIELQLLTGMRPGEACVMRTADIDTTGELWLYRPPNHKTAYRGHERTVYLGPRAQEIVRPWLRPSLLEFLFCPAEADAERREKLGATRKTPKTCGNVVASNRKRTRRKKPSDRYSVRSYHRAILDACDDAFPPPADLTRRRVTANGRKAKGSTRWETRAEWRARLGEERWAALRAWRVEHRWHPHQLRHSAGTNLRKQYGLEAAQVILGHRTLAVTEIYAEKNVAAAMRIMGEVG